MHKYWLAIKTFIHIQWNARATAIVLDDCTRAMGLMDKSNHEAGMWVMPSTKRSELVNRACWHALPKWQWRNGTSND